MISMIMMIIIMTKGEGTGVTLKYKKYISKIKKGNLIMNIAANSLQRNTSKNGDHPPSLFTS